MTVPAQTANAIEIPPTIVSPGYFTSIRPPTLRSKTSPSSQRPPRRAAPSRLPRYCTAAVTTCRRYQAPVRRRPWTTRSP